MQPILNIVIGNALASRSQRSDAGASLVEYALLVGLIAVVCAIAMAVFGTTLNATLSHSGSSIQHAG